MNNNIKILNSFRAFAALSVCLFHFVCTTSGFIQDKMILSLFENGRYGVQMFFVISGFIIPWSMYNSNYQLKNLGKFLLKRLLRLEPPYIFSLLFCILLIIMRQKVLNNYDVNFSFNQLALHIGYLIPFFGHYKWLNEVYWTLAIEFQYYILIALIYPFFVNKNKLFRYIIYILFFVVSFFENSKFLPYWLPIFLVGIILFLYFKSIIQKTEAYFMLIFLIFFLTYHYSLANTIFVYTVVVGVLFYKDKSIFIFSLFGEFSYSIYLLHPIIGASFINYFSHNIIIGWQKNILILFSLLITLFSSWLLYICVEKPSKKLSSNIKY
jgi:peptidoglycan/LPS O-acetylase OafA/YrhL